MKITIITDMQFGSTGKGLLAGYLALKDPPDAIVTAWAPNAGHTFCSKEHGKMVVTALPNGMVSPKLRRILIGPGSVINPQALAAEVEYYAPYLGKCRILVHGNAAVVDESHRQLEAGYAFQIGSTMKGVGEATVQKIRRDPKKMNRAQDCQDILNIPGVSIVGTGEWMNHLADNEHLMIEGHQGYSLGINSGFYPYTTSRECTTEQILSDCLVPFEIVKRAIQQGEFLSYGVARTYPIRVANRYTKSIEGKDIMIGTSGPCYTDQEEIKWADIYLQPELTTVTKLPRRIFTFSMRQVMLAAQANGCNRIFLNFCNYDQTRNRWKNSIDLAGEIMACTGVRVSHLGWGPAFEQVEAA